MKNHLRLGWVLLGTLPFAPALMTTQVACARPANVALHKPKAGSRERSAIINALRVPVQKFHKGKRPTFTRVNSFRVGGGWAHLSALTVDGEGQSLGFDADSPSPNCRRC